MKSIYINTRFTYVWGCIPTFITLTVFDIHCYLQDALLKIFLIGTLIYCILFLYCVWETSTQRKLQDAVIANGRCVVGKVKRLKKVYYESSVGRFANNERSAYRIEAEVVDEFGVSKIYYSALIPKSQKKYIPPSIKIYCYMDRNCMVWEKGSYQIEYPVAKSKEIVKGNQGRLWLVGFNNLALTALAGCLIGCLFCIML